MARKHSAPAASLFPDLVPQPPEPPRAAGWAEVCLNRPVPHPFTYAIPPALAGRVQAGMRVAVPFGSRREVGVVVALRSQSRLDPRRVKPLARVLDPEPLLDADLLELTRWVAREYACSWGEALHAVLPTALKREREAARVLRVAASETAGPADVEALAERAPEQHRLLRTLLELDGPADLREILRQLNLSDSPARTLAKKGLARLWREPARSDPLLASTSDRPRPSRLSPAQSRASAAVAEALRAGRAATFLLEGVTGSGKTEVYLRAIECALELGRGAIVLVPEIALTPQTVGWFRSRFESVAVLHSRMTDAQRLDMWTRVRHGRSRVVVGARSAVFAPVAELGVLVVDEEHEPSFKQGSVPRYHARDVAVERARAAGAVCLLGSATPSLESFERARSGAIGHLELGERIGGRPLPPVEVVDMRQERFEIGSEGLFSRRLEHLLAGALERREQIILFLNRRGFAPVLWCPACRTTVRCPDCDVSLTFHRRIGRAVCHSCCREIAPPRDCATCSYPSLRYLGAGSERIDRELRERFPSARVARMDSDTMRRRQDYESTLEAFGRGDLDVLVGTQMIAKGLDFPRVTLVGIVNADAALHLPDFRAAERTFQLLAQVSGRAGRGQLPGRIVVQTSTPDHPAIQHAAAHDYRGFARVESALRGELGYPPHGRLLRIVLDDPEEERVRAAAERLAQALRAALGCGGPAVLGPAPAPFAQLRGRFRRHVLVKAGPDPAAFEEARARARELGTGSSRPRVAIDVDPVDLL